MDTFPQAIAVVSAICIGIFAVMIFSALFSYSKGLLGRSIHKNFVAQDFINKNSIVTVALSGGETIERVKFLGYTTSKNPEKDPIPNPFLKMAVFENNDHEKIFVPTLTIRYIKELPIQSPSAIS